ncbi:mucin-2-like [Penaeus indicus]|uniref:mucin-2-like n=1 Tax=Penaeus indicus TaxID=29960 RepID=UPI00300CA004
MTISQITKQKNTRANNQKGPGLPPSSACYEYFQVDDQNSVGISENVYVTKSDIPETIGVGDLLYTLSWESGGAPGTPDNPTFTEYFEFDASETDKWKVKIKKSLEGLPDYPDSTDEMITNIQFTGFPDTCNVQITHNLKDENTASPQFDSPSYAVSIREDYPVELDIGDLQIKVSDFDKDSPNNQFAVTVEGSPCPLRASQDKYTSVEGALTLVSLWLTSELDYEEQQQLTCTLKAQDLGAPSLTATADLTVNVENRQDEPPVFGHKFYYSTLESSMVGEVLDVKPEAIRAENVEGTGVTYSMENARSDVNGLEYFAIDSSSGTVSVTKDIDNSFLENERVSFILKAEATTGGGGADFSALEVTLPPVPTTTPPPTTTPTTTTPPPTTTPTMATCPACTCPTLETTTPWPTTSPATCPPCEPSTTEAATCTPCPTSTPCPTLPTGESTVAATECPTCAPPTLSSWLSTLASAASCPPCPSTAATGTTTTPHDTEPPYTSDAASCPPCPTTAMPGTTTTPTTCPTTCPECPTTCPPTEGPTTCPECPTTYPPTDTPTTCPECPTTYPPTDTPTTCPECPTTCPSTETPTTCPECPTTCPSTETPTTCPECPTTYPSTETPTTCPECPTTCPSTETPATCPECPTTCPSTETPATCPECPTTCPPTETPTTCPDCPTSCPECPTSCPSTETPTTCPSVTCPSTDQPPGPTLTFKKASYAGEIFATTSRVWTVGVVEENADVTFSWEGGEDENFAIDPTTGEISSRKPELEIKEYTLTAVATAGELSDTAQVIIKVIEPLDTEVMIRNNLLLVEAEEGVEQELAEVETVGDVAKICVTDVTVPAAEGFFSVELVNGAWKLKAKSTLDYEVTKEISFKLKAQKDGNGDCSSSGFSDQLLR